MNTRDKLNLMKEIDSENKRRVQEFLEQQKAAKTTVTIKAQWHGSGTVEHYSDVVGFYATDDGCVVLVFDDESSVGIGKPDFVGFCKPNK